MREAHNGEWFVQELRGKTGLDILIIDSELEERSGFCQATHPLLSASAACRMRFGRAFNLPVLQRWQRPIRMSALAERSARSPASTAVMLVPAEQHFCRLILKRVQSQGALLVNQESHSKRNGLLAQDIVDVFADQWPGRVQETGSF